jgi:hypothetical protein
MDQVTRLPDGTFRPGYSGNPRGPRSRKELRDERMIELAAEFGGVETLSPGDKAMLGQAADLLNSIRKTTSDNDKVRIINTVNRIVQGIRSRHAPKRVSSDPWLVELLDDPHEDRAQPGSARDGMRDPATPPAGERNGRTGERPCASGEHFESEGERDDHVNETERGNGEILPEEESFERRIERARIGDVVRIGNVEVEIIADDDESAE